MAVRHGYGKIAGTDALVFAYDTGDTRNSYKGEPTVNLVTNGNFSNGSTGWGYNGSAASYSEVTTFEGRTVFKSNGLMHYSTRGYLYQTITGLTSGATYTISFDYYIISGQLTYDPDSASNNNATFTSPTGVWKTHTDTFTAASTAVTLNFWGIDAAPGYFYITNIQCELKSHKTPFVNGTRSATQGLLDLTGNSSIDLSNVTFDSNAQMAFDGTNDQINLGAQYGTDFDNTTNSFTVESVFRVPSDHNKTTSGTIFGRYRYSFNYGYGSTADTLGTISFTYIDKDYDDSSVYSTHSVGTFTNLNTKGNWNHVTATYTRTGDSGSLQMYVNGELSATSNGLRMGNYPLLDALIGNSQHLGSTYYWFEGDIPIVKAYSRALTADEVRNNYRHYKNRFGI